jgi:CRISPR/Cas system CSM-associated protein Csm3 (group 7 of RAMP superfamily)
VSGATTTIFLPYTLTLRAPAIATALSGDPNSAATQPFIPGGAIRGAVAARLLAAGEPAEGEVFRNLVLTGTVRYLHAYPEIDGRRAMPAPQSWRSEKARPDRVWDLTGFGGRVTEEDDPEDLADLWPDETLVSLGALFTAPSSTGGARSVAAPRIDARLHQQRDRVKGRPWTAQVDGQEVPRGAIFAYEYLEPGQVFRGLVQVHLHSASPVDANTMTTRIRKLLDRRSILVGRSRRAGYGGDAEIRFDAAETHAEYGDVSAALTGDLEQGQRFRVLLVSAYVGRHPVTGQLAPEALAHELRQRGLEITVERQCWSFETIGSFNKKWRLEVPQATAASAGSVFVLKSEKPIPIALLRGIERDGLGERRMEGFGRVLFLRYDEEARPFTVRRENGLGRGEAAEANQAMDMPAAGQLTFLEGRIVLSAARRELDRVASDLARRASKLPTTSLLGRIRTLFRAVHDPRSARRALRDLRTWCENDGDHALKPEARKKLKTCRTGSTTLLEWLRALAQPDGEDSAWCRLVEAAGSPTTLSALAHPPSPDHVRRRRGDPREPRRGAYRPSHRRTARDHGAKEPRSRSMSDRLTLDDAMPGRTFRARWVIRGVLRLETATHLGGEPTERVDMPVLRDPRSGGPLLPGTTLAGSLRNALADRLTGYGGDEPEAVSDLFGGRRGDDDGTQSPVIVFDALGRLPDGLGVEIRDGVAISAASGTAEDHKKYDYEVLPAGTIFPVRVDILVPEKADEKDLVEALATSLDALSHGEVAFGAKRSRGLGRVSATWVARRFDLTSPEGWQAWVQSDHEAPASASGEGARALDALRAAAPDDLASLSLLGDGRHRVVLDLDLTVEGALLVRSPGTSPNAPDVSHLTSGGSPILPGTSLAGVLRSQALRIARLVRRQQADATRWIDRLFGPRFEGQRPPAGFELFASRLRVGEAVITGGNARRQTRIAIDRFTQGVIPTALFDELVHGGGSVQVRLELRDPRPGELGLLLLVLKDLLSGELAVGGASSIGRGVLKGSAELTFHDGTGTAPRAASICPGAPPTGEATAEVEGAIRQFLEAAPLNDDAEPAVGSVEDGGAP